MWWVIFYPPILQVGTAIVWHVYTNRPNQRDQRGQLEEESLKGSKQSNILFVWAKAKHKV
jgi:hypothetical protein